MSRNVFIIFLRHFFLLSVKFPQRTSMPLVWPFRGPLTLGPRKRGLAFGNPSTACRAFVCKGPFTNILSKNCAFVSQIRIPKHIYM